MRSSAVRFGLFVGAVLLALVVAHRLGFVDWVTDGTLHERILALRNHWWTPLLLLALFVLTGCVPLPATAVVLAAGAVYGTLVGSALNWVGCLLGAAAGWALARGMGRDFVLKLLGSERSARLESLVMRHGFWTMVRARWMMPLAVANYGGGLGGMKLLPFLASSMVGMTPPLLLYTYVGHLLGAATGADTAGMLRNVSLAIAALFALSLVGPVWRWWRRRGRPAVEDPAPPDVV